MIRAFLAVPLDEAMRARYSSVYAEASRRFKGLRWVRPENTHITLRFLGDSTQESLDRLRALTGPALVRLRSFQLTLGLPGAFGPLAVPRTIWFGIDRGVPEMKSVAEILETISQNLGYEPEGKPWSAHITVARNPDRTSAEGVIDLLAKSGLTGMSLDVTEATLFSSKLLPGGPVYTTLWKCPLGAPPGGAPSTPRQP